MKSTGSIVNKIVAQEKYKKFYRKMTLEETHTVNQELLKALHIFDRICRENGLDYMLVAGALIGAVRDQSCIPWDDDIDVIMPRPDYYKFREALADSEYAKEYKIVYPEDNHVITMAAHFYREEGKLTKLVDSSIGESKIYEPYAYIDILPLDSCKDSSFSDKMRGTMVNMVQLGYVSRRCYKKNDPFLAYLAKDSKELRRNLRIRKCFAFFFLPFSQKRIFKWLDRLLKYDEKSKNMTVSFGALRYFGEKLPREIWLPVSEVTIDGLVVLAPKDAAGYLTNRYGDYMTVPSKEEQEERMIRLKDNWEDLV